MMLFSDRLSLHMSGLFCNQQVDDMMERTPPDSPHVRSGVSSFSHISSPTSYQFSRDGDASDEEGSSWSSDEVLHSGFHVTPVIMQPCFRHTPISAVARPSVST